MNQTLGGFRAALLAGWIALSAAGMLYARAKGIPAWAAVPILAAFLIEYPFYLVPAFPALRTRWKSGLPAWLVLTFITPYVVYAVPTHEFHWLALAQLAALAIALSLWYRVLPPGLPADMTFLALVAFVILRGYLDAIYTSPVTGLHLGILGHLALTCLCAMVMLVERGLPDIGFGFLPSFAEFRIGAREFIYFLIIGIPLAWATRLVHWGPPIPPWKIAAIFLGTLWVVALSEEFFFRGLLQQWLAGWTGSSAAALAGAAIIFGALHLGFRGFPNWRFALTAAVAGWFYGRAYRQTGSIRASMVTHALVVTLWRSMPA